MEYLIGASIGAVLTLSLLVLFATGSSDIRKRGAQPKTDPLPYPPRNPGPLPGSYRRLRYPDIPPPPEGQR